MSPKSIVFFYSWAGHTEEMAGIIASKAGADIREIKPKTQYPKDYNKVVAQAKAEINKGFMPPIEKVNCELSVYDIIYIGTPIWWGTMAPPLAAFLHENDFSGKIIMPFSTHGGGGKGSSDSDIAKMCSGATVKDMHTTYEGGGRKADAEISAWLSNADLPK